MLCPFRQLHRPWLHPDETLSLFSYLGKTLEKQKSGEATTTDPQCSSWTPNQSDNRIDLEAGRPNFRIQTTGNPKGEQLNHHHTVTIVLSLPYPISRSRVRVGKPHPSIQKPLRNYYSIQLHSHGRSKILRRPSGSTCFQTASLSFWRACVTRCKETWVWN